MEQIFEIGTNFKNVIFFENETNYELEQISKLEFFFKIGTNFENWNKFSKMEQILKLEIF
jgi:hypothetical protein